MSAEVPPGELATQYQILVRSTIAGSSCEEAVEQFGRQLLAARVPVCAVWQMHERISSLLAHTASSQELTDGLLRRLLEIYDRAMNDLHDLREEMQEEVRTRRHAEQASLASHQALSTANNRLKQWIEDLRHFNYSLAHDLKAPVRTALSFIDVYLEDNDAHLGDRTPLDIASEQLGRLQTRIDDVLEMVTLLGQEDTGESVDLGELLTEVVADHRAALETAQAALHIDPLPTITGNRHQLRVLLENLLGNAIKYRQQDRPLNIEVRELPTPNAHTVSFAVSDNGIGIDQRHQQRIFRSFTRLHTEKDIPGTGLGLTMAALVCDRHGGRVDVESTPGAGTTFKVILRRALVAD